MNPKSPDQEPFIARYQGNRKAAFSLTFDDGFAAEVEDTLEIIDPLNIKGTFFLIPFYMDGTPERSNMVTWERVSEIQKNGHEIGTHGSITEKLHEATDERLDVLINESRRILLEKTGVSPTSYAAPGGSVVDARVEQVIRQHHETIRLQSLLPHSKVIGYGNVPGLRIWEDMVTRSLIEHAMEEGEWVIPIVHAIVGGYSPFNSKEEFRTHCEWVKSQEDRLWIAPLGTVGSYVFDREASTLEIQSASDQSVTFSLVCEKPYRQALTVVIPANGATEASAKFTDGTRLPLRVQGDAILVDVPKPNMAVAVNR
jgi:peptidoglycan/xylan/chitin deacetylase (PgdA/CDA1 family)